MVEHVAEAGGGVGGVVKEEGVVKGEVDDMVVVVEEAAERRTAVKSEEMKAESEEVGRVKEELVEGLTEEPELDEDAFSDDDLL